ncbi:V-containing nitrogenase subunit beta [Desulfothermus naphthae]
MNFVDPMQADKLLGVFRVVSGLKDAVVVVHSPVGCHWGINYIQRLSYRKTNSTVSALRERSVIFGGHEHLKKSIEIIFKNKKKDKYLIILCASVPSIIGDDIEGIILESSVSDVSYLVFDCGGYKGKMMEGYEEAIEGLFPWIEEKKKENDSFLVNIIGIQRDIPMGEANIKQIKRMLSLFGIKVNSIFPPESIKEIKNASCADLNIVFGYGKGLAERMKERFGIPYLFFEEYPYGISLCERFLKKVAQHFGISEKRAEKILQREKRRILNALKPAHMYLHTLYDLPVAVSGDPAQVKGISNFLSKELGFRIKLINVSARAEFSDLSEKVLFQASMHEFENNMHDVNLIFGSDTEKTISKKMNIPLIQFSYPILSRIFLNDTPYLGFKGISVLVEEIINQLLNISEREEV